MICSKLWTDTNINLKARQIKHCCKQTPHELNHQDFALGGDMFEGYKRNKQNKLTMLSGNLPEDCSACYDGMFRNAWNLWQSDFQKNNPNLLHEDRTDFIEIDLGDQCDIACTYCGSWNSTAWKKEKGIKIVPNDSAWTDKVIDNLILRLNQIRDRNEVTHYARDEEYDPHVEIAMLGGEPTLMPQTYRILDRILPHLKECERPVVSFSTNLNTGDKLMKRFLNTVERTHNNIEWRLGVSLENTGTRAEIVRTGLRWEQFLKNLDIVQDVVDRIYFCNTHNYLSMPYFADFVNWCFDVMRMPYGTERSTWKFTNNAVTSGALSVDYIDPDTVPWDTIYKTLQEYKVDKEVEEHIRNIHKRSGRAPDTIFRTGVQQLIKRDPRITEYFPHVKI